MLFNSFKFLIFFGSFLLLYFPSGLKLQNIVLLIAGLTFYASWNAKMSLLLVFCILFNYYAGNKIYNSNSDALRKKILIFFVILNLLILFIFKYTIFVARSYNDFINFLGYSIKIPVPEILLPVGISFYTFHNISYIADLYKGRIKPAKSIISFGIYDLFFPLLLAGPIERAEKLLSQVENKRNINYEKISSGLSLFLWGIMKKTYIADNLSIFVDKSLAPENSLSNGMVYIIAFAFAFQVYADFSGYTDAARGLARCMGFELSLNFRHPFLSPNPAEFWKRWHISLSTWLRDYIYIPLGGNRLGFFRQNMNLMIVWILGGLWHGATYGYFIWGIYCGLQVITYNIINFIREKLNFPEIRILRILGIPLTFMLFGLGLLLFRVDNPDHLERLLANMAGFYFNIILYTKLLILILPIIIMETIQIKLNDPEAIAPEKIGYVVYALLFVFFSIPFTALSLFETKEFFYFQF